MFKDFDLTKAHLQGVEHYQTPRTRDPEEAQRRRELHGINKNLVVLEGQARGIGAAILLLQQVQAPEDRAFTTQIIAESSLNSAWYTSARDAKEMRKRIKLPIAVARATTHRSDGVEMFQKGQVQLSKTHYLAMQLPGALSYPDRDNYAQTVGLHFGQAAGEAGLHLACIALADEVAYDDTLTHIEIQEQVRDRSLEVLASARDRVHEIGVAPSLAQLAHADSPLSVWWRNNAPDGAYQALNYAQEQLSIAA